MLKQRTLGKSDITVPNMMFGGNVFGWTVNEADSFRLLDRALDLGLNFIDTADVYSRWVPGHVGGESETILGKWFSRSGKRDRVILATKVGKDMGEAGVGLGAKHIREAVESSLRRLQTDRIDLYQSHDDDRSTPLEETMEAFTKLVKEGKVRVIGASNYDGARLREAIEVSRKNGFVEYQCLQPLYNLAARQGFETDLAPVVAEYGLAVITFYSLALGFLTGKYRKPSDLEGKARSYGVAKYMNQTGYRALAALDEVAADLGTKPGIVALAWLTARPGVTAPIVSATSIEHLEDIAAAAQLELSDEAMVKLNAASAY